MCINNNDDPLELIREVLDFYKSDDLLSKFIQIFKLLSLVNSVVTLCWVSVASGLVFTS